jgi:hypothetical protein
VYSGSDSGAALGPQGRENRLGMGLPETRQTGFEPVTFGFVARLYRHESLRLPRLREPT